VAQGVGPYFKPEYYKKKKKKKEEDRTLAQLTKGCGKFSQAWNQEFLVP
jgi:hypothetical protein